MAGPFPRHEGLVPLNVGVFQVPPPPLNPPPMELLHSHTDWRRDWTHIVAGKFTDSPYSALLFYDQSTGFVQFYATDGHGGIQRLAEYSDWRTTWTRIVAGEFVNHADWSEPRIDDLFFYEGSTGYSEAYESDGHGGISLFGAQ